MSVIGLTRGMPSLLQTLALRCRQTREELDLTQQQLADRVGLKRGYIAMIEGGRANPSVNAVERLAHARHGGRARRPTASRHRGVRASGMTSTLGARSRGLATAQPPPCWWAASVEIVHARSHGWIDLAGARSADGHAWSSSNSKTRPDDLARDGASDRVRTTRSAFVGCPPTGLATAPSRDLAARARDDGQRDDHPAASRHLRRERSSACSSRRSVATIGGPPPEGRAESPLIDPSNRNGHGLVPDPSAMAERTRRCRIGITWTRATGLASHPTACGRPIAVSRTSRSDRRYGHPDPRRDARGGRASSLVVIDTASARRGGPRPTGVARSSRVRTGLGGWRNRRAIRPRAGGRQGAGYRQLRGRRGCHAGAVQATVCEIPQLPRHPVPRAHWQTSLAIHAQTIVLDQRFRAASACEDVRPMVTSRSSCVGT